jgi:hypothetical protein
MWGQPRRRGDSISHDPTTGSDLFVYNPPTSSRVQESVPTRLEGKFSVGLTCQASNSKVTCNVETDVRRDRSNYKTSRKLRRGVLHKVRGFVTSR